MNAEPQIIEEVRTGTVVRITVETPWPVPADPEGSMAEAALYQWAQDALPEWADYYPTNAERTSWEFIAPI